MKQTIDLRLWFTTFELASTTIGAADLPPGKVGGSLHIPPWGGGDPLALAPWRLIWPEPSPPWLIWYQAGAAAGCLVKCTFVYTLYRRQKH